MIEDQVTRALDQVLPAPLIKYTLAPFLDKACIIVCLLTKNDESNIKRCLDSLDGIADGLCTLDVNSTDQTVKLIDQYASLHPQLPISRFVSKQIGFDGFDKQKNRLIEQARQLAVYHAFPPEFTFLCFICANERIMCNNYKLLKSELSKTLNVSFSGLYRSLGDFAICYQNVALLRIGEEFCWKGLTHEYLSFTKDPYHAQLPESLNFEIRFGD